MNINDIMARDIREEAELQQREAITRALNPNQEDERRTAAEDTWIFVLCALIVAVGALGAAFAAGMNYQSSRDLKAQKQYHEWLDKTDREATERVQAMSNTQLLATDKKKEAN